VAVAAAIHQGEIDELIGSQHLFHVCATNSPSASGGIIQYSIFRLVMPFFERPPDCHGADGIHDF
jgi:hypothetical protein